jgi:catechol 2,3-dioxygenase-like lactoylglutathione lyase family enzyme
VPALDVPAAPPLAAVPAAPDSPPVPPATPAPPDVPAVPVPDCPAVPVALVPALPVGFGSTALGAHATPANSSDAAATTRAVLGVWRIMGNPQRSICCSSKVLVNSSRHLASGSFRTQTNLEKEAVMLGGKEAIGTVAVKDLTVARKFYEGTLGLKLEDAQGEEAQTYRSGPSRLIVYRSQFAGTNKATALNFIVGADIEKVVRTLKERGVTFEHYDLPGLKLEGDLHVADGFKTAWFKDPDGNIISLM